MSDTPDAGTDIPGMTTIAVDGLFRPCETCGHPVLLNQGKILAPGGVSLAKEVADHDVTPLMGEVIPAGTTITWITPHAEDCAEAEEERRRQQRSSLSIDLDIPMNPEVLRLMLGQNTRDDAEQAPDH